VYYPDALSKYVPHSGTYKFPPLFLSFLIPFAKHTDLSLAEMEVIWFSVDLFLYVLSVWLLVHAFNTKHWIVFSVIALNYEPFFWNSLWTADGDIYSCLRVFLSIFSFWQKAKTSFVGD
jgi:hypothetical protein